MKQSDYDVCKEIIYKASAAEKSSFEELEARYTVEEEASDIGVTWEQ